MKDKGLLDLIPIQRITDFFQYQALRNSLEKAELPFLAADWFDFSLEGGISYLRAYRQLKEMHLDWTNCTL